MPPKSNPPFPEGKPDRVSEPCGYFLALSRVTDLQRFEQYRSVLTRLRHVYQGRSLVQAQPVTVVLGPAVEGRLSLVEHSTVSHMHRMMSDPEYLALVEKLRTLAPGPTWAVKGTVPGTPPLLPAGEALAYAVARFQIPDTERLKALRGLAGEWARCNNGRVLVRVEPAENVASSSDGSYLTIVEFASMPYLQAAIHAAEFRDVVELGLPEGTRTLWVVRGPAPPTLT